MATSLAESGHPAPEPNEERCRVWSLTSRLGRNSISQLAGHTAERFHWIEDDAVVAYTVRDRIAVALGDPIAPGDDLSPAVLGFRAWCASQRWRCLFHQTDGVAPYRDLGFRLLPLGAEALVAAGRLGRLEGGERADLRFAVRRSEREGLGFRLLPGPLAQAAFGEQIATLSAQWLDAHGGQEMTFSLGSAATLADAAIQVAVAVRADGRLEAFVTWLPAPRARAWTLDLMRRRPDATYGAMEFLLVRSAAEAARQGMDDLNLGLAPFFLGPEPPPATLRPVSRLLYERLARFRRSESLCRFKAKFGPRWELRYAAIDRPIGVPRAFRAMLRAHAGGDTARDRLRLLRSWR
ncbi:MAG: DUF2156 domain-containing protein [Candidatus Dormiibacterota bacterium]